MFVATVHELVPEQGPLQPAKMEPAAGAAVRVTLVPLLKVAEHRVPQLMLAGELVTVPLPVPALVTERAKVEVETLNVAVTALAAFMVTEQPAEPEQAPLQPAKVEPRAGVAVRVTTVPLAKLAEHVVPQLMAVGELVTAPPPVPAFVTARAKVVGDAVKVAVTVVVAVSVTVQEPVPEQPPPLQPVKLEPLAGAALRVTAVPLA
jgi:hypothetical protein